MPDAVIEFDEATVANALGVEIDDVIDIMRTGTGASPWMERRIREEFDLDNPEGNEDGVSDKGPVEIKGITKYGVKLVPSWMVGSGRSVDWDALNNWLDGMSGGFILHDNTKFPSVPCWLIETEIVKEWAEDGKFSASGGMTYETITSLLDW